MTRAGAFGHENPKIFTISNYFAKKEEKKKKPSGAYVGGEGSDSWISGVMVAVLRVTVLRKQKRPARW